MCRVVCVFVVCGRGGASVLSLGSLRPGLVSVGAVVGLVASVVVVGFRLSLGVFPGAVSPWHLLDRSSSLRKGMCPKRWN